MRRVLLALLALAGSASAQDMSGGDFPVLDNYDLDATSATYCRYITSTTGLAEGPGVQVFEKVVTSGSSTSVTALSAATTAPFTAVAVGDLIDFFPPNVPGLPSVAGTVPGGRQRRYVVTRTDADNIVVDSAVNLGTAGATFVFWKRSCGTAATDGWVDVTGQHAQFSIGITQMVVTGFITYQVECRTSNASYSSIVIVDTANISAASPVVGNPHTTDILVPYASCRVGLLINSADDGNDLTTNLEQVFVERAWWKR